MYGSNDQMICGKVTLEILEVLDKYNALKKSIEETFAIGDYEELFFKILLEMRFSIEDIQLVETCYNQVIEDIYG